MRGRNNNSFQNSIIANNAGIVDLDQQKPIKKRNHFLIIFPIIIFILFSGICFGGYYYYENYMVESTQSIYLNYLQKIDIGNILDEVLYSKISNKNNSIVHNTNAKLSVKSKANQDEEDLTNRLVYDFDIFSNPQGKERTIDLEISYSDNSLFKLKGIEKDKYMAVSCTDILDDYIVWEKENTAYFMSKISNIRSKFDYNKVLELFDYQNIDLSSNEKNELFKQVVKIISKNTKKTNYEERPNVTFTDESGEYVEAIGYKLSLNGDESNKIYFEILKSLKENEELINKITQNDDSSSTNSDITTSNLIYKIIESIAIEKKMGISSSKLENILDSKMIEVENSSNQIETTLSIYIVEDKIRFFIADNGKVYIKCEFLEDSSIKLTYLAKDMPEYIDGTLKDIKSNFTEAGAFMDKALDGDYIAPDEPEEENAEEENPQIQSGSLRSIRVVGNEQSQEQNENNTQEVDLSTATEQNVEDAVNISEQTTNNSNLNPTTPNTPSTSTVNSGDGGTITIGEQGDVTYRNAPREVIVSVNSEDTLSREEIIEDSNVGEVDFSSNDNSTTSLRDEEHDIDNTSTDLESNLTDTSLYTSSRREFEANSAQSNGFTLIIKRNNQNSENLLDIEYDEIKNSQISSKYILQMNMNGTAESTEVKNDITINYYDHTGQKLINIKYTTKYGENTTEVPDIENDSLILDNLSEEDFDTAMAQIRGFILKYIKLKENQWNLITRNG